LIDGVSAGTGKRRALTACAGCGKAVGMDKPQSPDDMLDPAAMLSVAERLRAYSQQIRANPMAGLDADVLERASTFLEQAASELEAMRSEC
jgi:hypothetical protein